MRRQSEGGAVHDRDTLGFQQILDEILVGLDCLAGRRLLAERPGAGGIDAKNWSTIWGTIKTLFKDAVNFLIGLAEGWANMY
jgi:hypothetical protein